MNKDLINRLALEAGWTPIPGADFSNTLQEDYNRRLVHLVVQECCARIQPDWAKVEGMDPQDPNLIAQWATRTECVAELTQHFEVE